MLLVNVTVVLIVFKWQQSAFYCPAVWNKLSNILGQNIKLRCRNCGQTVARLLFSHRHKEATVTDSLKWKLTAWRMSILWNIFLCTIALQIWAPKRKLSGSEEDHSFQPSLRLVHSPSASDISDSHKHSSIYMRHKWWSSDILHQYMSTALPC